MSRRGLAAAAASAVVALSFAPLLTSSAAAQGNVTVTSSNFALSPAPGPGSAETTATLFVSGHFHVDGGVQPAFDFVSVGLLWQGPAPAPAVPGPYTICSNGPPPSGPPGPACSGADVDFNMHPLAPAPSYNGPYRVFATGKATDPITGQSDQKPTPNIDFKLVVPPGPVTGVTATADKSRVTTVSWDRDATTPDVQAYWIYRKGPGDADFKPVVQTPQLSTGARVTIGDSATANKGGDYVYQVETRRNGASGDGSTFVASDRSKSQSNKVTVADPPPGSQTVPTTPPPKGNSPPPVVRGTPSGVNRNSGFSGSSSAATTPTSEAVTPDPGFVRGLPYAGSTPGEEGEAGDNSSVAVTPGRHSSNRRGILAPVAGGAILFLGALHLRILKRRLDEPPGPGLNPVS